MIFRSVTLVAMATFSIAAFAEEAVEDRVVVEKLAGVTSAQATIAGKVLALTAARKTGGGRELILLVAPPAPKKKSEDATAPAVPCDAPPAAAESAAGPCRLIRFDPTGAGALVVLRDDLPADARDLAPADLDGDGVDELLLVRPTGVSAFHDDGSRRFSGAPIAFVETPDEELAALLPGAINTGTGKPALVSFATLGALRTYGAGGDGVTALRSSVELPLAAARARHGLELSSPRVSKLVVGGGVDLVVVDPEPRGAERLRTFVIRPGAPEEERRQEAWGKLPAAEKILESSFLVLDGRPALAVTTVPAGKLSFFGEKLLRVFFLEADRTRSGKAPVAALQTNANLWQSVYVIPADVNGDGKQDLVVAYWKGLKDDTVVLDAFLRRDGGTFEKNPRSTSFDVEQADRGILRYGDDLDGRGLGDLVLVAGGKLVLYPGGDAGSGGRKLVSAKPLWSVPLQGTVHDGSLMQITLGSEDTEIRGVGHPSLAQIVADLDGDGHFEIIVTGGSGVPGHVLAILPAR